MSIPTRSSNALRVLVIDDDQALRKALAEALSEDFAVMSADDGESGLAAAVEHHPDLVLLDISMPGMDGLAVIKKLRALSEWGKAVPVILLTSRTADDHVMKSVVESEPSFFLSKSEYTPAGVVGRVKEALGVAKPESLSI